LACLRYYYKACRQGHILGIHSNEPAEEETDLGGDKNSLPAERLKFFHHKLMCAGARRGGGAAPDKGARTCPVPPGLPRGRLPPRHGGLGQGGGARLVARAGGEAAGGAAGGGAAPRGPGASPHPHPLRLLHGARHPGGAAGRGRRGARPAGRTEFLRYPLASLA